MINMYENGIDLYIELSKKANPDITDMTFHKLRRQAFKSVVLGILYGRGPNSILSVMPDGTTLDEVKKFLKVFHEMFPTVSKFIDNKRNYCKDHDGKIDTFFGDKLYTYPDRFYTTGINFVIQNGASVMLGEGFENIFEQCYYDGIYIKEKVVVHDSNTFTTHIKDFFVVHEKIKKYFQQYIFDKYGIRLKYDLLTFVNFRDKMDFSFNNDTNTLKLSGSLRSYNDWMSRLGKYFTYDIVDYSESGEEYNTILHANNVGSYKFFKFYPETDFMSCKDVKAVINNIQRK